MFCKYCGKPVPDEARFCSSCGKKLDDLSNKNTETVDNIKKSENASEIPNASSEPKKQKNSWMKWAGIISAVVIGATGTSFLSGDDGGNTVKPVSPSGPPKHINNIKSPQTPSQPAPKQVASKSYNATTRPKIEEFNWTKTVMQQGVWSGAKRVTAFKDISGTWKCMNTYDPTRKMGKYCRDISNVIISGTEGNTKVLYDWYKIFYEGEPPQDMTKGPKTTMTGTYKKGSTGKYELAVSTKGSKLVIDQFYVYNGKQYAIGVIILADGTVGDVTMVRP